MNKPVKKVIFPVAGLGTRFLPASKAVPKELLPIVDKPLIQYAMEEAIAAGIEEFIFVTGRGKSALEDHFDEADNIYFELLKRGQKQMVEELKKIVPKAGALSYTRQPQALGLGHAVWCARNLVGGDEPFAVMLVDELIRGPKPCMAQVVELYNQRGGCVFALAEIEKSETNKYGIVDVSHDDGSVVSIKGMLEKPEPENAPSNLSIIGRYVLQPEVFSFLNQMEKGIGGEIQLTDSLAKLCVSNVMPFSGIRLEGERFDCGSKLGFLKANISVGLQHDDLRIELTDFIKTMSNLN